MAAKWQSVERAQQIVNSAQEPGGPGLNLLADAVRWSGAGFADCAGRAIRAPPARLLKGTCYVRRPQARIFVVCDAGQGCSCPVLRGGAEVRAGGTEGAGVNRRPGEAAAAADRFT